MSAAALLDRLASRGVNVVASDGKLRWQAPKGVMTEADLAELRAKKSELLASLSSPDIDGFEERAAIAEYEGELPREQAEALASREQGFDTTACLHLSLVEAWALRFARLATMTGLSAEAQEVIREARAFIYEGHALEAVSLGWDEAALFGVCPNAPWQRLDRKGAAFFGTVTAVTRDCVVYATGLRRYRYWVNNDGGAVPIWTLFG